MIERSFALQAFRVTFGGVMTCFLASALAVGCPDPEGEFDEFADRQAALQGNTTPVTTTGGGMCSLAAAEWDGQYLFSLSAVVKPKPLLFIGDLTITADGNMSLSLTPLDKDDHRTPVGSAIALGPFPVNMADGTFAADLGELNVPGQANTITGADITATVTLNGSFCTETPGFICGTVAGAVTKPTMIALMNATFTLQKVEGGMIPPSLLDCAKTTTTY